MKMMALALALAAPTAAPPPRLTDIRMHLFYETTGRLSPDLTQVKGFAGWNVIIGAGDAEEPADDLMVVAELQSAEEEFVKTPLAITVTNGKGKVLASRVHKTFVVPHQGHIYLPLWVRDAGCAGTVNVNVLFGSQQKTESLGLHCGE